MIRLRSVSDLAAELKVSPKAAQQRLSDLGIRVIGDMFDQIRFEAALAEPQWLRDKRNAWTLTPRTGLGAVKHILDPLGVVMVEHECRGAQYLMLRRMVGPARNRLSGVKVFCKMYYKGQFVSDKKHTAAFDIVNFMGDSAPRIYLGMCFEGPMLWAFDTAQLCKIYRKLLKSDTGSEIAGVSANRDMRSRELGGIHALVDDKSPWLLTNASQLGL
jgi:hypothetical protein